MTPTTSPGGTALTGQVALVAGATRGAGRGIAVELGAAGATGYVSGRTTRSQAAEYARPETIEASARHRTERGHLGVLGNDIWGGEKLFEWNKAVWEHDLANGLRLLRLAVDTH